MARSVYDFVRLPYSPCRLESSGISLVLRGGVIGPFLPINETSTRLWLFKQISGVVQKYNTAHS